MGCFKFICGILSAAPAPRHKRHLGELPGENVLSEGIPHPPTVSAMAVGPNTPNIPARVVPLSPQTCVSLSWLLEDVPQDMHGMVSALNEKQPSLLKEIWSMCKSSKQHYFLNRFNHEGDDTDWDYTDWTCKRQRQNLWNALSERDQWDFAGAYILADGEFDSFVLGMIVEDRHMRRKLGQDILQLS